MHWDEKTTREYLEKNRIAYSTYETILNDRILDYKYSPYLSMLKYGQLHDTCSPNRTTSEIKQIVHVCGEHLIVFDPPGEGESCSYQLVQRNGLKGDCQVGGTLKSFLAYLHAWISLINTPGPFGDSEI
jgi:hypothetical protein